MYGSDHPLCVCVCVCVCVCLEICVGGHVFDVNGTSLMAEEREGTSKDCQGKAST